MLRRIRWQRWIERIPGGEDFVLSLDMGTSALKWVLLRLTKEGPLFLEGGIEDPTRLLAILKEKVLSKKYKIRVAISGPKVLLKRVFLPKMPLKEVATALRWQIREEIPFPIQETYLDFQVIQALEKEKKPVLDLLVGVAHRDLVDPLVRLCSEKGPFEIDAVVPGVNTVTAFLPPGKGACALVDLGASTTYIGIFHEGLLEVGREIPIGGENLTQALACEIMIGEKKFSFKREEAERAKLAYGISQKEPPGPGNSEIPPEKLWILMRPILERLLGELKRFFQVYGKGTSPREIEGIWVTGGGAGLQGFGHLLERHLGFAPHPLSFVERFHFAEGFFKDREREEMERRLGIAVATALLRKKTLNFLPPQVRASRKRRFRARLVKGVSLVFGLFLLSVHTFFTIEGVLLEKKMKEEEGRLRTLTSQRAAYLLWMDKKKEVERRIEIFSTFAEKEPLWEGILKELSWIVPNEISLNALEGEVQRSLPGRRKDYRIRLKGEVSGSKESGEETLTHFLEVLEASPFFRETKLVSTEGIVSPTGELTFEVTGRLELD